MKIRNRLAALIALATFGAGGQALAATAPGTSIDNQASVAYEVAGSPFTEDSNIVSTVVDELVDVTVADTTPNPRTVLSPSTNQAVRFTVTHLGNGSETYDLAATNEAGDDFQVAFAANTFFRDVDNDGVFEPAGDDGAAITQLTLNQVTSVARVWVVSNIPASEADGNDADVRLTATSTNRAAAINTTAGGIADNVNDGAGAGDTGVEIVWGASTGLAFDISRYTVIDLTVTAAKTVAVNHPTLGVDRRVPGAELTYTIVVSATGSATGSTVVFTDPIPADTTYQANSIVFDGDNTITDGDDADECDFNVTNPGEITCELPNLSNGSSHTIVFTVVID